MSLSKRIILDTNFLMVLGLFGVDVVSEIDKCCNFSYKLYVLDKTIKELDGIILKQKGKEVQAAKLAKKFIELKKIKIIDTADETDYVDDLLVKLKKEDIVATNDVALIKRLKEEKIKVLRLRQKKYIVLE